MNKLKVAVLFGGISDEHDISIKSAKTISENISLEKYEPVYVYITKNGNWKLVENPNADLENSKISAILSPDRSAKGLILQNDNSFETKQIDVIFPVIHGKTGEDGQLQGLFELSGIPYVGCDIPSSAICIDKTLANTVARSAGINTPDFWIFEPSQNPKPEQFDYPVFVKPARSGSSFGVQKVNKADELEAAVLGARKFDGKIIVEEAIFGDEIGCAVLGQGDSLTTGEVDQIIVGDDGFFHIHLDSNPEKNGADNATIKVPAELSESDCEKIKEYAKRIYQALGCKGLARVDMFLQKDGRVVLNEVNTLPGFTSYSRYPSMMRAAGLEIPEVIDKLISLALN